MARKTIEYVVTDEGRDFGKRFLLTEMGAYYAERWARHVYMLVAKSQEFTMTPENVAKYGWWAVLASIGINGIKTATPWELEPYLDELLPQIQIMLPDAPAPRKLSDKSSIYYEIEEPMTIFKLRYEVIKLHADFLEGGAFPNTADAPPQHPTES